MTRVATLLLFYYAILEIKINASYDLEGIQKKIIADNKLACPNIRIVKQALNHYMRIKESLPAAPNRIK